MLSVFVRTCESLSDSLASQHPSVTITWAHHRQDVQRRYYAAYTWRTPTGFTARWTGPSGTPWDLRPDARAPAIYIGHRDTEGGRQLKSGGMCR